MFSTPDTRNRTASKVMEGFGLRWAILAAWNEDLRARGIANDWRIARMLEGVRVQLASGRFSGCEIGCGLAHIEAALVSRSSTVDSATVREWLEELAKATSAPDDVKSRPWLRPAGIARPERGYRPGARPS